MIETQGNISKYLNDYYEGKITNGLGTGLAKLDEAIRYKQGQFNMVNGLDNVGKTAWMMWYFLVLSMNHKLRWCIWAGENRSGQLVRQLIEFKTGRKLKTLEEDRRIHEEMEIAKYFTFINNQSFYTNQELYGLFRESEAHGALIDPFTGLNRQYTHAANYEFLNESREWCNKYGTTLYVNTHPVSLAARTVHALEHPLAGYPMPPSKSNSEGGQPFANRPDDFLTLHRYVGHPEMQYKTLLYVRKVKDTETGGEVSPIDEPIEFDFNRGLGFTLDGINPISNIIAKPKEIENNLDFDKESNNLDEQTPF